jgi:ABC-type uncharacterized transport system permease subunit
MAGLLFPLSLLIGSAVGLALEMILGALTVILDQSPWALAVVRHSLFGLLAGAIIPLDLMPWQLGTLLAWLPFAAQASAPLKIYVGLGEAGWLLASQLVWAVLLWWLADWLWRSQRERFAVYGG